MKAQYEFAKDNLVGIESESVKIDGDAGSTNQSLGVIIFSK
jgi:hypothetical protein